MNDYDLTLVAEDQLHFLGKTYPCVIGRGGVSVDKKEGDGATPCGSFSLREVYYRPDRMAAVQTSLPLIPLTEADGWCDDSADALYNQHVTLPYAGRHEKLWREEPMYDLILVVGYNDAPVIAGRGSAIFIHLMGLEKMPTEGCIAFAQGDLIEIFEEITPESRLVVPHPRL